MADVTARRFGTKPTRLGKRYDLSQFMDWPARRFAHKSARSSMHHKRRCSHTAALLGITRHILVNDLGDALISVGKLLLEDICTEGRLRGRLQSQHRTDFVVQVHSHIH